MAVLKLLDPEALARECRGPRAPLVVDVGDGTRYLRGHIPNAVHLDYAHLVAGIPPAPGLPPHDAALEAALAAIGLENGRAVVAYDDQGNSRAARLLWTLAALGHGDLGWLDSGLQGWLGAELPLEAGPSYPDPSPYQLAWARPDYCADKAYIQTLLGKEVRDVVLLDVRSEGEYLGIDRRALRGGHIPGAVNFEWSETIDPLRPPHLKDPDVLVAALAQGGVTPDREVVVYCQTHHRSAHTFAVLRTLGFERVRGYAGSWSEWGNDPDLPVAP